MNWAWQVITVLGKLRQKDYHEFKSFQDYSMRPMSKTQTINLQSQYSPVLTKTHSRHWPHTFSFHCANHWKITNKKFFGSSQPSGQTCTEPSLSRKRAGWRRLTGLTSQQVQGRNSLQSSSGVTVPWTCLCWKQTSCERPWPVSSHFPGTGLNFSPFCIPSLSEKSSCSPRHINKYTNQTLLIINQNLKAFLWYTDINLTLIKD